MSKMLFADPDKCTGCNRCTYVCSAVKTGEFAPTRARIQINNFPHKGFSVPSVCFQCPGAQCRKACPSDAFYQNKDGALAIAEHLCTGCGTCVEACPYGMIEINQQNHASKCDLCDGDPACVKECFPAALVYQEPEPGLVKLKGAQMKQRAKAGSPADKRHELGSALLVKARG